MEKERDAGVRVALDGEVIPERDAAGEEGGGELDVIRLEARGGGGLGCLALRFLGSWGRIC